jgi:DNA-binding NtrC family response regulator
MRALLDYDWPGNIRELINVIERAMLLCRGESITEADLPEPMGRLPAPASSGDTLALPEAWDERPFQDVKNEMVARFERKYLSRLLERTGGKVGESARLAGIAERTLYEKMRRLGVRKEDFRESGTDRA